jgi:hypothetical protein
LAFSIPGVIGDLGVTGVTWRVIGYRRSKARQQSSLNMAKTRREPRLKGWHGFSVPRFSYHHEPDAHNQTNACFPPTNHQSLIFGLLITDL